MNQISNRMESNTLKTLPMEFLHGLSQIMLQQNAITGILFLIGIFWGSISMGFAALTATLIGTLTARWLGYDKVEIYQGLYGFSPALVGVASLVFFKLTIMTCFVIIIGSAAAAILQHYFIRWRIPAFTFPFVLVTWVSIYLIEKIIPEMMVVSVENPLISKDTWHFVFRGYGQVIFQGSVVVGVLFFVAVLLNRPISAIFGLIASLSGASVAMYILLDEQSAAAGLWGFNAVLCAIALAGKKVSDGMWALISVTISLVVTWVMMHFGLVQLTFPFVFSACLVTYIKNYFESRIKDASSA